MKIDPVLVCIMLQRGSKIYYLEAIPVTKRLKSHIRVKQSVDSEALHELGSGRVVWKNLNAIAKRNHQEFCPLRPDVVVHSQQQRFSHLPRFGPKRVFRGAVDKI